MIKGCLRTRRSIISSSLSKIYKRSPLITLNIIDVCPSSNEINTSVRNQRTFTSVCDTSKSILNSKISTNISSKSKSNNFCGQKRCLTATHEKLLNLEEQLKHVALSQASSTFHPDMESNVEALNTVQRPKKSLIQDVGIEGANNFQRIKMNTNEEVALDTGQNCVKLDQSTSSSLWVAPPFQSDLIVALDMDECLIHAQFLRNKDVQSSWPSSSASSDNYRQYEADRPYSFDESYEAEDKQKCDSFQITLPDGDLVHVNMRPHLSSFLNQVCSSFETYVFTAAKPVYACPVLDKLDTNQTLLQGRFYREHCSFDPKLGVYVKDLQTILKNRKLRQQQLQGKLQNLVQGNEERIVLIDNNPLSFLANPSNGILVSNFYDDPSDETLPAVLDLLMELGKKNCDVRPRLNEIFGLKDALTAFTKQ